MQSPLAHQNRWLPVAEPEQPSSVDPEPVPDPPRLFWRIWAGITAFTAHTQDTDGHTQNDQNDDNRQITAQNSEPVTPGISEPPLLADEDTQNSSFNDTSFQILGYNDVKSVNPYASLLDDDDDEIAPLRQYGTSLFVSENSRYNRTYGESYAAPSLLALTDIRAASSPAPEPDHTLDVFHQPLDEYLSTISRFYLPSEPVAKHKYSLVDSLIENLRLENDLEHDREKIQLEVTKERQLLLSKVHPLQRDQQAEVDRLWSAGAVDKVICSAFSIEISIRDLLTLADRQWLNDNVIDFYFNLISQDNPEVFGWTTHFFTTLQERGYQGVARWLKRKKLNVAEKAIIFVPINILGTHWALAVVDNTAKSISYMDSLASSGNLPALETIREYMVQEGKKHNLLVDFYSYTLHPRARTPQQLNGYDCGVFTCQCARYLAKKRGLLYGQKDMKTIRRRMAYEIISKKLLNI